MWLRSSGHVLVHVFWCCSTTTLLPFIAMPCGIYLACKSLTPSILYHSVRLTANCCCHPRIGFKIRFLFTGEIRPPSFRAARDDRRSGQVPERHFRYVREESLGAQAYRVPDDRDDPEDFDPRSRRIQRRAK